VDESLKEEVVKGPSGKTLKTRTHDANVELRKCKGLCHKLVRLGILRPDDVQGV
jgi:hypothetical protein